MKNRKSSGTGNIRYIRIGNLVAQATLGTRHRTRRPTKQTKKTQKDDQHELHKKRG